METISMQVDLKEVEERVIDTVVKVLGVEKTSIKMSDTIEYLGADSLAKIDFLMLLEDEFNEEISNEEAESLISIENIVSFIGNKKIKKVSAE